MHLLNEQILQLASELPMRIWFEKPRRVFTYTSLMQNCLSRVSSSEENFDIRVELLRNVG